MKMFKGFVITLAGLFIFITFFSLLIPSKILTVKSVIIQAPAKLIYSEITDLHRWQNWQPLIKSKSSAIKYTGIGKGATASWNDGNKLNQVAISSASFTEIHFTISKTGENNIPNIITLTNLKDSTSTEVQWQSITNLSWYPWEKFAGIFVEKITGPILQESLNSLKNYIEKKENY